MKRVRWNSKFDVFPESEVRGISKSREYDVEEEDTNRGAIKVNGLWFGNECFCEVVRTPDYIHRSVSMSVVLTDDLLEDMANGMGIEKTHLLKMMERGL